jgi:hypothetical protein
MEHECNKPSTVQSRWSMASNGHTDKSEYGKKGASGGRWDFMHPDGRGIRFNQDGSFYSFLN